MPDEVYSELISLMLVFVSQIVHTSSGPAGHLLLQEKAFVLHPHCVLRSTVNCQL